MQSTDLDNKITGRRRVVQKSLEYACYSAVTLTAILMIIFFATLGYRGIGAFTQTKIEVDVVEVQSTSKKSINEAMYRLVKEPDRTTKKGLRRVSIVATSLDGQQPEPKSVINMVHRIQNRNPGYSDFSNTGSSQAFTFSNQNSSIITNGANALKIEEEVKAETESHSTSEINHSEELINSTNVEEETNTVEKELNLNF